MFLNLIDDNEININTYKADIQILYFHIDDVLFHLDTTYNIDTQIKFLKHTKMIIDVVEHHSFLLHGNQKWFDYLKMKNIYDNYDMIIFDKFIKLYPELII